MRPKIEVKMPASRPPVTRLSAAQRSRISNRVAALAGADQRSAPARRFRDIAGQLIADAGGVDRCSEARLQIIRRLAGVSVLAEQVEGRIAHGSAVSIVDYATLASTAVRLVTRLGIDRRAKAIVPTLEEYLEHRASLENDDDDDDAEAGQ